MPVAYPQRKAYDGRRADFLETTSIVLPPIGHFKMQSMTPTDLFRTKLIAIRRIPLTEPWRTRRAAQRFTGPAILQVNIHALMSCLPLSRGNCSDLCSEEFIPMRRPRELRPASKMSLITVAKSEVFWTTHSTLLWMRCAEQPHTLPDARRQITPLKKVAAKDGCFVRRTTIRNKDRKPGQSKRAISLAR
jgi:hypothetical protein